MFLNIILTLLTIVLITITVLVYIWWKKYGKQLFDTMNQMKSMTNNPLDLNQAFPNMNMGDLFQSINALNQTFNRKPKK